jgi:hypothetical protein
MSYNGSKAVIGRGYTASIGSAATSVPTPPTGITGTTASSSPTITALSSTTGILVGMAVSGTGVPTGATVISIVPGTSITLSANATASGTTVALTFSLAYTLLGELDSSDSSGREWDIEEVTNFESNVDKEHIKALRNPGTITLQGNRVENDAGQLALEAAFESTSPFLFQIQLPPTVGLTNGEIWTFTALVLSVDPPAITPGKTIKFSSKLQVTGPRTITAGS